MQVITKTTKTNQKRAEHESKADGIEMAQNEQEVFFELRRGLAVSRERPAAGASGAEKVILANYASNNCLL